jgi:CRP-like cAMP-binding protein/CheY-like chemotaxis protein
MKAHIVLIEDNDEVRDNIAEILELDGYAVDTAPNGKEGVRLVREKMPDLIICDIMMPELDGFGVLHMLNRDPGTAHIPFIFLTAKSERDDFRKGMNLGADDYITKPFEELQLLDAVQMRLDKRRQFQAVDVERSAEGLHTFISEARAREALQHLSEDREVRHLKRKEIIYREGDRPRHLFLLQQGKVKAFRMSEDGKEYITDLFKPGDFFGISALMRNTPYGDTAEVLEDADICLIPADDFHALLHNDKDVSHRFIQLLADHLEETEVRLVRQAYDSVRKRVADGLLLLEARYRERKADTPFRMHIMRDDLAGIVGTAKETVIRTLTDFRQEGLVDIGPGGEIVITNHEGLEHIIA